MPSVYLFYIFLTSLFTSLVLIPNISRLAVSIGIFDAADERKSHTGSIPRLGGIAIFFAVLLGVILFTDIDRHMRGFLAGAVVIFLTGLTDDLEQISPKKKFLGELLAALIVTVVGDLRLTSIGDLFGAGNISLGYLSIPFTVFGIVGVINAINLMDGLDGLAGGVTAIAAAAIGMLAYVAGDHSLVCVCAALLGGVMGFLKFNSYPARIFMGDGGSLFLGYCLAVLSVHLVEFTHARGQGSVLTPLIILAVPVFDTLFVMGKRLLSGKGLFMPDRTHIHHRFMGLGLGHKSTVILVYGLSYFLAAYAVMFRYLPDRLQLVNLFLLLAFFCLSNWALARMLTGNENRFLRDDQSLFRAFSYRWMVRYSQYVLVLVKYLILAILIFPMLTFAGSSSLEMSSIAWLLIILTVVLFLQTSDVSNRFLRITLYFNVAFLIFVTENNGRSLSLAGVPLHVVSAVMFACLFVFCIVLLLLRKKSKLLIDSPLEYFILFIAITIPMLPVYFTQPIHLLTVAGKSMVLFLGFKMIFLLEARRNRKIIAVTMLALLFVALRNLF
jgi:UDP-GlcNAc:undecaprenyl-phosphate/decaprenyl-phosphate GlcNAc-1-phosphate transferase